MAPWVEDLAEGLVQFAADVDVGSTPFPYLSGPAGVDGNPDGQHRGERVRESARCREVGDPGVVGVALRVCATRQNRPPAGGLAPGCSLERIAVEWAGLGKGRGWLMGQKATLRVLGRGKAGRPLHVENDLPAAVGTAWARPPRS